MSQNFTPVMTLPLLLTATVLKNTFVDLTGANATAAAYSLGVALVDGIDTQEIYAVVQGTAPVIASAAISAGALVEVAANGQVVTHSAGVVVGRALEAAAGPGSIVEILLLPN